MCLCVCVFFFSLFLVAGGVVDGICPFKGNGNDVRVAFKREEWLI